MSAEVLADQGSWRIVAPADRLIDAHLALVGGGPDRGLTYEDAADLIAAYRAATSALHQCLSATGFMISFAWSWRPYGDAVGEPNPVEGFDCAVHVFGRRPGEPLSPVRAMAVPRPDRRPVPPDPSLTEQLRQALLIHRHRSPSSARRRSPENHATAVRAPSSPTRNAGAATASGSSDRAKCSSIRTSCCCRYDT